MPYARITGTGGYLPPRVVSNDELAADLATRGVETSNGWIVERTGILQRHIAEPGTPTSTLATAAARAALDSAGLQAGQIDLIIVATSTPDYIFPSTACMVQDQLGVGGAAAFDVQAVCSGFVYAMATADAFIRAGRSRHALVVGAEVFSGILDWNDRRTCVLFGDGAGAVVLSAADEPGILATRLNADGRQHGILCAAGNVFAGQVTGDPFLRMDGQAVFKLAVTSLVQSALEVCAEADIDVSEIDWMVPHQANVRILNFIGRRLGLPDDRLVITLDRHANTSAASVPLALDVAWRDGRIRQGQTLLLQGVGGGFTWGSILVKT